MRLIKINRLIRKLLFLWIFSTVCFAQQPTIKSINPVLANKKLAIDLHFQNLLREELIDGLASGMSRSVNFNFVLLTKDGKKIQDYRRVVRLKYDVWEDIYIITNRIQKKQFKSFNKFNRFLNDSLRIVLGPIKRLDKNKELLVQMFFVTENISEKQKTKLKYWIDDQARLSNKTDKTGDQSGFSINLSGLISLFTTQDNIEDSIHKNSSSFSINSLKTDENTSK
jgi:hypothetical protein